MISSLKSLPESRASLSSLTSLLEPQLSAINACILEKLHSAAPLIAQIAGYLISLGGKRLRPLLTVASAELCGYEGKRHIHLAACVEFIHTATLLHDDVVDKSQLRRGMPTANTVWSNKASVLVGDFLFSRAFELMVEDQSLEILHILSRASSTIAEGEVLQLASSNNLDLTQETYLRIIGAKTAQLFSAAAEVGAVIAGVDSPKREALSSFGYALGIAFQLMDDVLDYTASQHILGKTIGDDFQEGKVTLPVILAYAIGEDNVFWEEMFSKKGQREQRNERALAQAVHLLKTSGALFKTKEIAQAYIEEALACLKIFPPMPLKSALEDLAHFSLYREV